MPEYQQGLTSAEAIAQLDMETMSNSQERQPYILNYVSTSLAKLARQVQRMMGKKIHLLEIYAVSLPSKSTDW